MNIEDQVVSLELAQKLKDLGVKQESCFIWKNISYKKSLDGQVLERKWMLDYVCNRLPLEEFKDLWVSAFTVAELGKMLNIKIPNGSKLGDSYYQSLSIECSFKSVWLNHYYESGFSTNESIVFRCDDENEADARAKLLIILIEMGLVK